LTSTTISDHDNKEPQFDLFVVVVVVVVWTHEDLILTDTTTGKSKNDRWVTGG